MRTTGRIYALDALRGHALLLGVVYHSLMPYVIPPGGWAVGTRQPVQFLAWLAYYLHSFRLELFFLMAGFFGALTLDRRGVRAYLRDRARRILLVFLVALYPMKLLLTALWIAGGQRTGWFEWPADARSHSVLQLSVDILRRESWSDMALTHLWFLYYLACISALFVIVRGIAARTNGWRPVADRVLGVASRLAASNHFAPLGVAVLFMPLLAVMRGVEIDTPERGLPLNLPALTLFAAFFFMGSLLYWRTHLISELSRRWRGYLLIGAAVSVAGWAVVQARYQAGPWAEDHGVALRIATAAATSVTMTASVFGWLGCFIALFERPITRVRRLADASYWIYVAHLPLMAALQVMTVHWGLPWWIHVPLMNLIVVSLLLFVYDLAVRYTWLAGRKELRALPVEPT
jgi:peptidoglycan/LPS O-acetylase OafA/YrhL